MMPFCLSNISHFVGKLERLSKIFEEKRTRDLLPIRRERPSGHLPHERTRLLKGERRATDFARNAFLLR